MSTQSIKPDIRATGDFYSTASTKFLQTANRVATAKISYGLDDTDAIATIPIPYLYESDRTDYPENAIELTHSNIRNGIGPAEIEKLLSYARQSKVGKGTETVEDTKVRSSREIPAGQYGEEGLHLIQEFYDAVEEQGQKMLSEQLGSNVDAEFHFYKMVIYKEDDHVCNNGGSN